MRKVFLGWMGVVGVISLVSCNSGSRQNEADETVRQTSEIPTVSDNSVMDGIHTSKNSLDYQGTYQGTLPGASGEGMETVITLNNDTYTKEVKYTGKSNDVFKTNGKYTWNEEGNMITLEQEDHPNQYLVGENTLTQLDMSGNKITGDLADQYILLKTED